MIDRREGFKVFYSLFKPNQRNIRILNSTFSCKIELKEDVTFSRIFQQQDFSLIFLYEQQGCDGRRAAQRPVVLMSLKWRVRAAR
jgi:hypothetical protein